MTTSVKNSFLPPSLISSIQQAVINKSNTNKTHASKEEASSSSTAPSSRKDEPKTEESCAKPIVLVTNAQGIESPGLKFLVQALLQCDHFSLHVCAPQTDRSVSSHSVTVGETVAACSADIEGLVAYEVSGTPADCISLALSGALWSWSKPALVISGINMGSNCGYNMFYSGAGAAAREALICGVPSLCISLNWKKGVICEGDLKDAADVCLPLICAAIRDVKKGVFPGSCLLNIEIPSCPLANKGFKVTKQSPGMFSLSWRAVPANRHLSTGNFMSNQQSLGIMLAQLGRDASAAVAARRLNSQRKNVEIESVGIAEKFTGQQTAKKYFRLELVEKQQENADDQDIDRKALEDGFVSITPLSLFSTVQSQIQSLLSNWIAVALGK